VLPLQVAAEGKLAAAALPDFDPFHLVRAEPGRAVLASWDGEQFTERELPAGLHVIVNSGLASELAAAGDPADGQPRNAGRDHELARIAHFLPRLRAAARPVPRPGGPVAQAWGQWLTLLNGDGLPPGDPRALIIRHDLGDGRIFGTTSISLIALSAGEVRYDFTGTPGDPAAWYPVDVRLPG
jgi:hypothetical protein